MILNNEIYSQQIKTTKILNVYTHDELPEGERFIDQRSSIKKIIDNVIGQISTLDSLIKSEYGKILTSLNRNQYSEYCYPKKAETWNRWKNNSKGLHVLVHGFKGHPIIWDLYIKALRESDPKADIRAPFVPKTGNCRLEKATTSIRTMVNAYIREQIDNKENTVIPISLYGVSNGARITLNILNGLIDEELEVRLKEKGLRVAIKVDNISGILRGTTDWKVRFINKYAFTKWIARNIFKFSLKVFEEFQYKSDVSTTLLDTTRKINNTANVVFNFAFYASTEDRVVEPYFSSLPVLGKGESHNIVHGEGHTGLVDRVFPHVMDSNKLWRTSQAEEWERI